MALKGRHTQIQEIHRASASKHDLYSAMGATADFDESFEPELGDAGPSVAVASGASAVPEASATSSVSAGSADGNAEAPEGSVSAGATETADFSSAPVAVARFQLLYESRDGKVAVFEDEHGHIVAVDAKRLV